MSTPEAKLRLLRNRWKPYLIDIRWTQHGHSAQPLPKHLEVVVEQSTNPRRSLCGWFLQIEVLLRYPVR